MEHEELWDSIKALEAENKELKRRVAATEQNVRNLVLLADELRKRIAALESEHRQDERDEQDARIQEYQASRAAAQRNGLV